MLFEELIRRTPLLYGRAQRLIAEFDTDDVDAVRRFRDHALNRVVRKAAQLKQVYPVGVPFDRFPYLTKDEVRANPEAYLRASLLPSTTAKTSGTSGASMTLHRSLWCVVFEEAILQFLSTKVGADFNRDRVAVLRGVDVKPADDRKPPFWRLSRSGRWMVFSSNHLSAATSREFIAALRDFAPGILWAYPSTAAHLADLVELSGEKLRIPAIMTGSEMLHSHVRRRLSDIFEARTLDYYGQGERTCFAYSVEDGVYRFISNYGLAEFLPVASDTSNSFEIVGTSYNNFRQILVRYRTGDIVRFNSKPKNLADIGAGLAPFGGVSGRDNDVLKGLDGEVLVGIDHIPRGLEHFGRFQFCQPTPHLVEILVATHEGGSPERTEVVKTRARMKIPSSIALQIHFVEDLRRTKAGKVPFIYRTGS